MIDVLTQPPLSALFYSYILLFLTPSPSLTTICDRFGSTAGKEVEDNAKGAAQGGAKIDKKREYRQYLNRPGGGASKKLDDSKPTTYLAKVSK